MMAIIRDFSELPAAGGTVVSGIMRGQYQLDR